MPLIWLSLALAVLYLYARKKWPTAIPEAVVVVTVGAVSLQLVRFPAENQIYLVHALPLVVLALLMITWQLKPPRLHRRLDAFMALALLFGVAKVEGRFFTPGPTGVRKEYVPLTMERERRHPCPERECVYERIGCADQREIK